jgi:putative oxidoreductase
MTAHQANRVGAWLLRVSLGVIFIAHSLYLKLAVFGLPGTAQYFASIGLPEFLAYVVFLAEALGGIALILGAYVRVAALLLVPVALGATWAHLGSGWLFQNPGGGWEYPLFLAAALLVQFFIGDGVAALRGSPRLSGAAPQPSPGSDVAAEGSE